VWPDGAPSRKGFARSGPLSFATMIVLGIVVALHPPVVVEHAPAVAIAAEYVGGVLILSGCVMPCTVMAINKPKFIVAPHRRWEPGVFEERRAARGSGCRGSGAGPAPPLRSLTVERHRDLRLRRPGQRRLFWSR
jgi:hypothetical protein